MGKESQEVNPDFIKNVTENPEWCLGITREVLRDFGRPGQLMRLGYDPFQASVLTSLLEVIQYTEATDMHEAWDEKLDSGVLKTYHPLGVVEMEYLSLSKDYTVHGILFMHNAILTGRFPINPNPEYHLIENNAQANMTLGEVGERMFPDTRVKLLHSAEGKVAKVAIVRKLPPMRDSLYSFYLDEDTRQDIAYYNPLDDEAFVYRMLGRKEIDQVGMSYDVYGLRKDVPDDDIKQSMQQHKAKVFDLLQRVPQTLVLE